MIDDNYINIIDSLVDKKNKNIGILINDIQNKLDYYHLSVKEQLKKSESRIMENIKTYENKENILNSQINDLEKIRNDIEDNMRLLVKKQNVITCPDTHVFNPKSKRCVSKTSKTGISILEGRELPTVIRKKRLPFGQCSENKIFNPDTNRCVSKNGRIGKKLLIKFGEDPNYIGMEEGKYMFKYKYKYNPEAEEDLKKLEEQLKNATEKLEVLNDKKEDVQELSKEHKNLLEKIKDRELTNEKKKSVGPVVETGKRENVVRPLGDHVALGVEKKRKKKKKRRKKKRKPEPKGFFESLKDLNK